MSLRWGTPRFSSPRGEAIAPRPLFITGENTQRKPRATHLFDGSAFKPERAKPPKYINIFEFALPDRSEKTKDMPERTDTRAVSLTDKDIKWLLSQGKSVTGSTRGIYLEVRVTYNGITLVSYEKFDFDLKTKKGNIEYMMFLWKYDRKTYYEQRKYVLHARVQTQRNWEQARDAYWVEYQKYVDELKKQARKNKVG